MRGLTINLKHLIIIVVVFFSLFMIQSLILAKSEVIIATIKDNKKCCRYGKKPKSKV